MRRRFVVAAEVSEHPIPAHAAGDCLGELLERGGTAPALVLVAVTAPFAGALDDVMTAVRQLLGPSSSVGVVVSSLLGGAREVEERAAVMMLGIWDLRSGDAPADSSEDGPGTPGRRPLVSTVRLGTRPTPEGTVTTGLDELRGARGSLLLFADPFSTDAEALLEDLSVVAPELQVVGGHLSGARHPGGNLMVLDGRAEVSGAVGIWIGPEIPSTVVVAQGGRAIGAAATVTSAEIAQGVTRVVELAGRPAAAVLASLLDDLSPEDRQAATTGLLLGRVLDDSGSDAEESADPGPADPGPADPVSIDAALARLFPTTTVVSSSVLGIDRELGAVAVHGEVPAGSLVRFEVPDPDASLQDLTRRLAGVSSGALAAFVVTSVARGARHHGLPDRDALAVADVLGAAPVAGVFLSGEFATLGGRHRMLTTSAAVLVLG